MEETTATERIYEGRVINVRVDTVRLPSGRESKREVIEHHGAVCLVPVTDEGRVLLVRQFRKPAEESLLEVPAGGLEEGESPEECAARELMEECGFRPGKLAPLYEAYLAPGYSTEMMYAFLATDLAPEKMQADDDESIEIESYTFDELDAMIDSFEIKDAKTIAAIGCARRHLKGASA
jgi:ADP-ribose pyrophosphatase